MQDEAAKAAQAQSLLNGTGKVEVYGKMRTNLRKNGNAVAAKAVAGAGATLALGPGILLGLGTACEGKGDFLSCLLMTSLKTAGYLSGAAAAVAWLGTAFVLAPVSHVLTAPALITALPKACASNRSDERTRMIEQLRAAKDNPEKLAAIREALNPLSDQLVADNGCLGVTKMHNLGKQLANPALFDAFLKKKSVKDGWDIVEVGGDALGGIWAQTGFLQPLAIYHSEQAGRAQARDRFLADLLAQALRENAPAEHPSITALLDNPALKACLDLSSSPEQALPIPREELQTSLTTPGARQA